VKTEEKARDRSGESPLWERVDVACGEVLCRPGEPANALYLVRSGRVELHHGSEENGSGVNVPRRRVVGPGEFFGEVDLAPAPASAPAAASGLTFTARALEDSTLLRIDGRGLTRQLQRRRGGNLRLKRLLGCGDRLVFLC